MKLFKPQKGFTLVEMVLYVALCSLFLLSLSSFTSFLLDSRIRSQAMTEVNQQGFQVMSIITQTIRNGRSIETPSVGTSSQVLSVTTPSPLLNPTVFTISSTTLMISEGGAQQVALTNSRVAVSDLIFQNISSVSAVEKNIKISFTVTYINNSGRGEYSFAKTFNGSAILR